MWLIVTLIATAIVSIIFFLSKGQRKRYKLGLLALMVWGTTLMVLVDHLLAFARGSPFIESTTDGLIKSGTMLGIAMLIPVFLIWAIAVFISFSRRHDS